MNVTRVLIRVSVFKGTVRYEWRDALGKMHHGETFTATMEEWDRAKNEYPHALMVRPLKQYTQKVCPSPQRHGQDEYHCTVCNVIWGVDEPRPPCDT
jgi:hypothetical protein